jgi:hypothetical protein
MKINEKNRKKSEKIDKNRFIEKIKLWIIMWKIRGTRIKNKTFYFFINIIS